MVHVSQCPSCAQLTSETTTQTQQAGMYPSKNTAACMRRTRLAEMGARARRRDLPFGAKPPAARHHQSLHLALRTYAVLHRRQYVYVLRVQIF